MGQELIRTSDGETVEAMSGTVLVDTATAAAMARVEIDSQIATARAYPRSIKTAVTNILELATLDEETAAECIYELPRGGKKLRGPSIRLAEIIASSWGNCRDAAQVVSIDRVNKTVTAEGVFHDLEANRGVKTSCQRRISDSKGKLFSDDMIVVTGNAACAIARRNAILAGVPKAVWRQAVAACEKVIKGNAATLAARRQAAITALEQFKLTPDQVFRLLDVRGIDDIGLDELVSLRVAFSSLKNGDQTVEDLLRSIEPEKTRVTASAAKLDAPDVFAPAATTADAASPASAQSHPLSASATSINETTAEPATDRPHSSTEAGQQPSLFSDAPQREQEPDADGVLDDLDVITRDLVTRLRGAAGNMKSLNAIVNETEADFALLDQPRRDTVQAALEAARKSSSKKVA